MVRRYLILGGEGHVTGRFEGDTMKIMKISRLLVENNLR